MVVQRLSRNDVTELVTQTRNAPQQLAAVLRFEGSMPAHAVLFLLTEGVARVPRLRQRLRYPATGLGRPIWVDDVNFDVPDHVVQRVVEQADSEAAALQVAASAVVDPLPRAKPLWAARLVTDAEGRCHALVLVVHHVLIDGIGGLAVLRELLSRAPGPTASFPVAAPSSRELLRDVTISRLKTLRSLPGVLRSFGAAMAELRGGASRRPGGHRGAPRSSLNRPIGPRRQLVTARANLPAAAAAAKQCGATINDVLLAAVVGALSSTLHRRGESADHFVVSVPVSGRRDGGSHKLGNHVGVIPVVVPTRNAAVERLGVIAGGTRAGDHVIGRGTSAALLGAAFQALARLGLFSWFVEHQHLVNTFVTNLHGLSDPLFVGDVKISDMIAISPISGNITVAFAALSYLDTLTVTVIADPDTCPDVGTLARTLQHELDELTRAPALPTG